jgi:hypothetical protein
MSVNLKPHRALETFQVLYKQIRQGHISNVMPITRPQHNFFFKSVELMASSSQQYNCLSEGLSLHIPANLSCPSNKR